MEILIIPLVYAVLIVAIFVAIARWVFRINDIVEKLHNIEVLLRNNQKQNPTP